MAPKKAVCKKRVLVEKVQRKRLIEIMKGIYMKDNVLKKDASAKAVWTGIAGELNQLGPAKEGVKWRKQWTDTLLRLRKRILERKELLNIQVITDSTIPTDLKLSIDDSAITNLFGGVNMFLNRSGRKIYSMPSYCNETISINDSTSDDEEQSLPEESVDNEENISMSLDSDFTNNSPNLVEINDNIIDFDDAVDEQVIVHDEADKDTAIFSSNDPLAVQRETLLEIRKLRQAQLETNYLLGTLIERLTGQQYQNVQHLDGMDNITQ